jgi:uncharacterized spore protein YtfJ
MSKMEQIIRQTFFIEGRTVAHAAMATGKSIPEVVKVIQDLIKQNKKEKSDGKEDAR